jgi:MOSC domain-containing protein YiiM
MNSQSGSVEGIFISPRFEQLPEAIEEIEVVVGKGIRGDRYFAPEGHEWRGEERGRDLTLIEAEALEALVDEHGIELSAAESRRNVLTRGIGLNDLVGKRFRVGEVECEGVELCEPCSHLEGLTRPGVMRGMVHRAGLRADVLRDGSIRIGDVVAPEFAASA